jgi:hypothetical protein
MNKHQEHHHLLHTTSCFIHTQLWKKHISFSYSLIMVAKVISQLKTLEAVRVVGFRQAWWTRWRCLDPSVLFQKFTKINKMGAFWKPREIFYIKPNNKYRPWSVRSWDNLNETIWRLHTTRIKLQERQHCKFLLIQAIDSWALLCIDHLEPLACR